MDEIVLDLDYAKFLSAYPDMATLFVAVWDQFTSVEYEALQYLVCNSPVIILRNVKEWPPEKRELLRGYSGKLVLD